MRLFEYLKECGMPDDLDPEAREICAIAERVFAEGVERLRAGVFTPEKFTTTVFSGFVEQVGRKYEGRLTLNCTLAESGPATDLNVECLGDEEGLNCVVIAVLEIMIKRVAEAANIHTTGAGIYNIPRRRIGL